MLDIEAGEEILYVGDHLYADVLRSKRALGWRSCFIMPELPEEMRIFESQLKLRNSIMELRKLREEFSQYNDFLTRELQNSNEAENVEEWVRRFEQIEIDDAKVKEKLASANLEYHSAFHPRWGQMFVVSIVELIVWAICLSDTHSPLDFLLCNLQAGYQDSRFGYFVVGVICLMFVAIRYFIMAD
jgi:hypothetical protein